MNKSLQRWMDKPRWQLCLWQWGLLSLVGVVVYISLLRPAWQQKGEGESKIIQLQQQVEQQTLALARLPSLTHLQQQITALLSKKASEKALWQRSERSLAYQVGEVIMPLGGQVIRWQRRAESEHAESKNKMEDQTVAFRRWDTTLRVNFLGLYQLFQHLSVVKSPILVNVISLTREGAALRVKLTLTEYFPEDLDNE